MIAANATPPAKVAASVARTTGRTSRVMLVRAKRSRLRGRAPPQRRDSVRARRPLACRGVARAARVRRGAGRFRASLARPTARRRSRPFRQRFVSSAGRSRRSSRSQTALRSRRARGRRGFVAGSRSTDRRSLGRRPRGSVGWSVGGGTRLPREKVPTSSCSANIVLASRLRSASLGSPFRRMRTTLVSVWSRPSIVPLQADVYARIAL